MRISLDERKGYFHGEMEKNRHNAGFFHHRFQSYYLRQLFSSKKCSKQTAHDTLGSSDNPRIAWLGRGYEWIKLLSETATMRAAPPNMFSP